jgi:acetyl esterase/lipase
MSIQLNVVAALARLRRRNTENLANMQARVAGPRLEAAPGAGILKIADVTTSTLNGCTVYSVVPKAGGTQPPDPDTHVIYLHGGAYAGPIGPLHWNIIAALVLGSGATVTVPIYELAPEHTFTEAYELLDAVIATITARRLFLAGDSAGGALALGEAMRLRDAGGRLAGPPPAGVILFSPWVDATMTNPDIATIQPSDPLLGAVGLEIAGRWWAGDADPRTPLVSPLFGDLADLPPVWIFQGGRDILAPDARLLADGLAAAGTRVELHFVPRAFHVWVAITVIPEARAALARASAVIRGAA